MAPLTSAKDAPGPAPLSAPCGAPRGLQPTPSSSMPLNSLAKQETEREMDQQVQQGPDPPWGAQGGQHTHLHSPSCNPPRDNVLQNQPGPPSDLTGPGPENGPAHRRQHRSTDLSLQPEPRASPPWVGEARAATPTTTPDLRPGLCSEGRTDPSEFHSLLLFDFLLRSDAGNPENPPAG